VCLDTAIVVCCDGKLPTSDYSGSVFAPIRDRWLAAAVLSLCLVYRVSAETIEEYVGRVAPLIDPAKLATLAKRGRIHGCRSTRRGWRSPNKLAAEVTRTVMLRSLKIATELGCFDDEGMNDMRH
jgi:hypothetical protein